MSTFETLYLLLEFELYKVALITLVIYSFISLYDKKHKKSSLIPQKY